MNRFQLGSIAVDCLTFPETLDAVESLVGRGGMVFTPNVDHVVRADSDARLRAAYAAADLSLADGMPLVWASRLLGPRLPAKISGSDLVVPLLERAGRLGWRVYFLGGAPGVAEKAAAILRAQIPQLQIVGTDAARVELDGPHEELAARIADSGADLVLVALGSPKQELFIHQVASSLRPAVLVGVGASLDFIAGASRRAPRWMSSIGLEWLHRLAQEPRRMWRRYLVRDPKFLSIVLRALAA